MIVPRLPGWHEVPLIWWLAADWPWLVVLCAAAMACPSKRWIAAYALAVTLPELAVSRLQALYTDSPVGHDVWVGDVAYWILIAARCAAAVTIRSAA